MKLLLDPQISVSSLTFSEPRPYYDPPPPRLFNSQFFKGKPAKKLSH